MFVSAVSASAFAQASLFVQVSESKSGFVQASELALTVQMLESLSVRMSTFGWVSESPSPPVWKSKPTFVTVSELALLFVQTLEWMSA